MLKLDCAFAREIYKRGEGNEGQLARQMKSTISPVFCGCVVLTLMRFSWVQPSSAARLVAEKKVCGQTHNSHGGGLVLC
jgi:hypothetical protein